MVTGDLGCHGAVAAVLAPGPEIVCVMIQLQTMEVSLVEDHPLSLDHVLCLETGDHGEPGAAAVLQVEEVESALVMIQHLSMEEDPVQDPLLELKLVQSMEIGDPGDPGAAVMGEGGNQDPDPATTQLL